MAIDESAGVKDRKDAVVKSAPQSYALALLLTRPEGSRCLSVRFDTLNALMRRSWIERRPLPDREPRRFRYHLTDAGRAVAEASPAVREWIEGWKAVGR
jgi:hypothetical protein